MTFPNPAAGKTGAVIVISEPGPRHNLAAEAQRHQGDGLGKTRQHAARGKAPKQAHPEQATTNCLPSPFGDNAAAGKTPALQVDTTPLHPNLARPTVAASAAALSGSAGTSQHATTSGKRSTDMNRRPPITNPAECMAAGCKQELGGDGISFGQGI